MIKRVSMKGRGADIFFGDQPDGETTPPSQPEYTGSTEEASLQASKQDIQQASIEPSKQAGDEASVEEAVIAETDVVPAATTEGKPASKRGKQAARPAAVSEAEQRDLVEKRVHANLLLRGTITNTFRFTDEELEAMSDIIYEMAKHQKVKINKNDIVRLGLNWVIEDYKASKQASLLARLLASKQ